MGFFQTANNLSIDFVNTLAAHNGKALELLTSFEDLFEWATVMNMLTDEQAKKMLEGWQNDGDESLSNVLAFRKILFEMFGGIVKNEVVRSTSIKAINSILRRQIGFPEVEETENGFVRSYRADYTEPQQLLLPIAEAAADLLCYGNLANVKKCENEKCVLLFYDISKNHSRRWCSMAHCGNQAKAAKFYKRKRVRN